MAYTPGLFDEDTKLDSRQLTYTENLFGEPPDDSKEKFTPNLFEPEQKLTEIGPQERAFSFRGLAKNFTDFLTGTTPESEIAKAQVMYSAFRKDVADSLNKPVKDISNKDLEGFSFLDFAHEVNKPAGEAAKNAFQVDRLNQKQAKTWWNVIPSVLAGDKKKFEEAKLIDSAIASEMQQHLDQYPEAKKLRQKNVFKHVMESAAGMSSYIINAQASGLVGGAVLGLGTAAVTRSPQMTAKAAQVGMLIGAGVYTAQIEGGSIYGDLVRDRDVPLSSYEDTPEELLPDEVKKRFIDIEAPEDMKQTVKVKGVDPQLAVMPAVVGGVVNSVIEVAQQALILRLPIAKGMSIAKKLEALEANPVTKKILHHFFVRAMADVPTESGEEFTQAVISETMKNAAYTLDGLIKQRPYMGTSAREVLTQAGEEAKEAAFGLAGFGVATAGVQSAAGKVSKKAPAKKVEVSQPSVEAIQERAKESQKALEGFRFKNTEEAIAYGQSIAGDEEKIKELEDERAQIVESAKSMKASDAKFAEFTKMQLLRESIQEARKVKVEPKSEKDILKERIEKSGVISSLVVSLEEAGVDIDMVNLALEKATSFEELHRFVTSTLGKNHESLLRTIFSENLNAIYKAGMQLPTKKAETQPAQKQPEVKSIKQRKRAVYDINKAVELGDKATILKAHGGLNPQSKEIKNFEPEERKKLFPFFRKGARGADDLLQELKASYPHLFTEETGVDLLRNIISGDIYKKVDLNKLEKELEERERKIDEQAKSEGLNKKTLAQAEADAQREIDSERDAIQSEASAAEAEVKPLTEETPAGTQFLIEGTPQREVPRTPLTTETPQEEDPLAGLKPTQDQPTLFQEIPSISDEQILKERDFEFLYKITTAYKISKDNPIFTKIQDIILNQKLPVSAIVANSKDISGEEWGIRISVPKFSEQVFSKKMDEIQNFLDDIVGEKDSLEDALKQFREYEFEKPKEEIEVEPPSDEGIETTIYTRHPNITFELQANEKQIKKWLHEVKELEPAYPEKYKNIWRSEARPQIANPEGQISYNAEFIWKPGDKAWDNIYLRHYRKTKELYQEIPSIWFSSVEKSIQEKMPEKAQAGQIIGILKNTAGVRQEEIDWLGIEEFVKDKGTVSKKELLDFLHGRIEGNSAWMEVTKPESIRKLFDNFFGRKYSILFNLDVVQASVLALSNHDQIRDRIVELIPVDMMNALSDKGITTEQIKSNPSVIFQSMPVDSRSEVALWFRDTLTKIGTELRTALDSSLAAGRDQEILPTLNTSDLNAREVMWLLSPITIADTKTDFGRSESALSTTKLPAESATLNIAEVGNKYTPTELATLLNRHEAIIKGKPSESIKKFEAPSLDQLFQTEPSASSTFEEESRKLQSVLDIHGVESITIELADKIITPRQTTASGAYDPATGKVRIIEKPTATTGYHEAFHILVRKAFDEARINGVIESVKSGQIQTDLEAEEYLAERFARYANRKDSKNLSDKIISFFEDLLTFIKRLIGFDTKAENLFNDMLSPDYYVPTAPIQDEAVYYQEIDSKEKNEARRNYDLSEQAKGIIRKYADRVGERYVPRGNLGYFFSKSQNIFVKALNDISTVTHEVTHFLDKKYGLTKKIIDTTTRGDAVRKEITRLYSNLYGGGKPKHKLQKRIMEGLATLIQNYAMNQEAIANEYPALVELFIKEGGRYYVPEISELIKDVQEIMIQHRGIGALGRLDSRVSDRKHEMARSTYFSFFDRRKSFFKDDLWRLEKMELMKGVVGKEAPSNWSRVLRNVGAMVYQNIHAGNGFWSWRNGTYVKVLDFNWGDLIEKTQTNGTSKLFGNWLVARRQYFMWQDLEQLPAKIEALKSELQMGDPETIAEIQNELQSAITQSAKIKSILTRGKFDRQDMTDIYEMFKDDFSEEARMFDALVAADLEMLADPEVMLIKQEEKDSMIQNEGYATYHMDIYNEVIGEEGAGIMRSSMMAQKPSFLKEFYGSELDVLNPLYGQLLNHAESLKKSMRQVVYNKLLKIAEGVPELFQRLPLKAIPREDGSVEFPQLKDPNIFMTRENYKKVPVLTNKEIKNMLDLTLYPKNFNDWTRFFLGLKRIFTVGTTSAYAPFAVTNFPRDQFTAAYLSVNNKFIPFYDSMKALRTALAEQGTEESELADEYFALGGDRHTLAGLFAKEPEEVFDIISEEVLGQKRMIEALKSGIGLLDILKIAGRVMEKGVETISIPGKYSELSTRLAEYILSRKSGKDQLQALEDAGRVSGAFHHYGDWGGGAWFIQIFKMIPYANASLQIAWQMMEKVADKDPKLRAKALAVLASVTGLVVAGFGSVLFFGDDEDKEQYKNQKPYFWASYIAFPNPFGKGLVTIPIPSQLGAIGALINGVLANYFLSARMRPSEFFDIATNAYIPDQFNIFDGQRFIASWMPQPISPAMSVAFNVKTFPEVGPIDRYERYAGSEKYKYASQFAIALGKMTNTSPAKIDYFIQGYLTRSIKFIPGFGPSDKGWLANAVDLFKNPIIREYYFTAGRNVRDYYEIRARTESDWSAYTKGEIDLSEKEVEKLLWNRGVLNVNKQTDAPGLNKLFQIFRELDKNEITKNSKNANDVRREIAYKISLLRR